MGLQNVPREVAFFGWVLFAVLIMDASRRLIEARRDFLPQSVQQHAWLGGIVALGLLWSLSIRATGELQLAMIGVPLYALLFGYDRALVGGAIALLGLTAGTGGPWPGVGVQGLFTIVFPAALAASLQMLIATLLPRHLFVFIIGNGLFVTLIAAAGTGVALVAAQLAVAPGAMPIPADLVAYALLLAWGEALASGMIFSALVIFLPQVAMTYAQDVYLPQR